ncbi:hypothetical protein CEXT_662481 [Caerostris extrusa]|uniref:Uncharacterized protein n=1 Tax=Caerostris extrusa TaxID=172846 RepID=A0AAV4URU3_CAEEX|nr:hypothetical protein CEXT_662481 [Caerostris extrusa]
MPTEAIVLPDALHSFLDIAVGFSFESHTFHFRRTLRQRIGFISVSTHRIEIPFHFKRGLWLQAPLFNDQGQSDRVPQIAIILICPVSAPWHVSCLVHPTCGECLLKDTYYKLSA